MRLIQMAAATCLVRNKECNPEALRILVQRFVNSYEVLVAYVSMEFYAIGSNREMNTHGLLARRPPMPTPLAPRITLSQNARTALHTVARAHSTPQSLALRARIILRLTFRTLFRISEAILGYPLKAEHCYTTMISGL
jgi:hypothetical protein